MKTSEKTENISKALCAAQCEMPDIYKSGKMVIAGREITYANLETATNAIRPILHKQKLFVTYSVDACESLPNRPKANKPDQHEYAVRVRVSARITHESGEWIEGDGFGDGQDGGDKGVYKATTGARKYALACLLGLATTDDPESGSQPEATERPGVRQTEPKAPKPVDELGAAQRAFTAAVKAWSGFKANEDVISARQQIATAMYNKPAKDMTIEELAAGTAFVTSKHTDQKVDFIQWSTQK